MVNDSYLFLLVSVAFSALGLSLNSGADTALIYDSLKQENNEANYKKVMNNVLLISFATSALYTLIGGIIGQYNLRATLGLPIFFYLLSSLIILFVKEPDITKKAREIQDSNYLRHTLSSLKELISKKAVKNGLFKITTHYVVFSSIFISAKSVIQVVSEDYSFKQSQIGLIVL
ncbi:MAG: hypothetical protein Q9M91_01030 [Candidatus Dojkabacteria bacterium]|nr:hypothetical protein [Candidatus Dojkabacteria bacterium]MDQ7020410.1 hypothetical protein [Candidatus Dojkabacteria bacterium]